MSGKVGAGIRILWGGATMKTTLVASALDGTLLNSAKQITETTAAILRAARKAHDVRIVLASARAPRNVIPFYSLLDLDTPMINYNGALVYDPPSRSVLMHRPIPLEMARRIVTTARNMYPEVHVSAEVLDRWYTDGVSKAYLDSPIPQYQPDLIAPIDRWLVNPVTKLLLWGLPGRLKALEEVLTMDFMHQVTVVHGEPELIQIMHATVSKAQALRMVAAELGTKREQVMAIGDNANDAGMLKWAGVGVAMANAAPKALAAADLVTDHHDADGAAKAIRKVILRGL